MDLVEIRTKNEDKKRKELRQAKARRDRKATSDISMTKDGRVVNKTSKKDKHRVSKNLYETLYQDSELDNLNPAYSQVKFEESIDKSMLKIIKAFSEEYRVNVKMQLCRFEPNLIIDIASNEPSMIIDSFLDGIMAL